MHRHVLDTVGPPVGTRVGVSSRSSHMSGGSSRSPRVVSSLLGSLPGARLAQGYRQPSAAVTSSYNRPAAGSTASSLRVSLCLWFTGSSTPADTVLPLDDASSSV